MSSNWIWIGLVAALAIFLGRHAAAQWASRWFGNRVRERKELRPDDPTIIAAEDQSRAERPEFMARMNEDVEGGYVALKDPRATGAGLQWAEVLEAREGRLLIRPVDDSTELEVPEAAVADWQIENADGTIRGGYTVRVVLDHLLAQAGADESVRSQRARYR